MALGDCSAMALTKTEVMQDTDKTGDFSERMEQGFNNTMVKVVETKMSLLDVVGRTINKTAGLLMGAKHSLNEAKDVLLQKVAQVYNKTAVKVEDLKEEVKDYKLAKIAAKHQPTPIVLMSKNDFLIGPTLNGNMALQTIPSSEMEAVVIPDPKIPLVVDDSFMV